MQFQVSMSEHLQAFENDYLSEKYLKETIATLHKLSVCANLACNPIVFETAKKALATLKACPSPTIHWQPGIREKVEEYRAQREREYQESLREIKSEEI